MKAIILLVSSTILALNLNSFAQPIAEPDSVDVNKATIDSIANLHQDLSVSKGDPLKAGNIYYFWTVHDGKLVGEILKIDSSSITIKDHLFEVQKIKKGEAIRIRNILTSKVFAHPQHHRADIFLKAGTVYNDAKIVKLKKDTLIIKHSSKNISIPVEQITTIDFAESPPLLNNSREIAYLIILWPLLPFCLLDPGLNTEFDLSYMDVKWKTAIIRCLLCFKYPGRFLS
jgi:hypothetical protein